MKDWEADKFTEVEMERRTHSIYFWIVPANVSGTWKWTSQTGRDNDKYVLKIDQQFQKINGTLEVNGSQLSIDQGELVGDKLQFTVDKTLDGQTVRMSFSGKVKGNSIQGNITTEVDTAVKSSEWKSKRDPSTVMPIEGSDKLR
jgi:hypothetical protein